jgi:hypothetical protein
MLNQLLEQIKDFAWKWVSKIYYVDVNTVNMYMDLDKPEAKSILSVDVCTMERKPNLMMKFEYNSYEEMEADLPSVFMRVVEALEPTILLSENCTEYITEKINKEMDWAFSTIELLVDMKFNHFKWRLPHFGGGIEDIIYFGGSEPAPIDMSLDYSFQLNANKALLTYHERCPICHYPTNGSGHRCILTTEQL